MLSLQGNQCFISQKSFWGGGSAEEEERWVRQRRTAQVPSAWLKPEPCGRVGMTTSLQTLRSCWQAGSHHHHHLLQPNPPVPRAAVTRPFVQHWKQGHHREEHSTVTLYSKCTDRRRRDERRCICADNVLYMCSTVIFFFFFTGCRASSKSLSLHMEPCQLPYLMSSASGHGTKHFPLSNEHEVTGTQIKHMFFFKDVKYLI